MMLERHEHFMSRSDDVDGGFEEAWIRYYYYHHHKGPMEQEIYRLRISGVSGSNPIECCECCQWEQQSVLTYLRYIDRYFLFD